MTASPANSAALTPFQVANETARRNFAFAPEAVTIAFAELELPRGVHEASRVTDDDVSIRIITDYIPTTDQNGDPSRCALRLHLGSSEMGGTGADQIWRSSLTGARSHRAPPSQETAMPFPDQYTGVGPTPTTSDPRTRSGSRRALSP